MRNDHSDNARLKGQLSAVLRDQLVGELKAVDSADAAAIWARPLLPAKNYIEPGRCAAVGERVQARLAELEFGLSNTEPQPSSFGLLSIPQRLLNGKDRDERNYPLIERIEKSGPVAS